MLIKKDTEIIEFYQNMAKDHYKRLFIEAMDEVIKYARHLNKEGKKMVSHPLPGSDMIHRMLKKKLISNDVYEQLLRVVEDPTMEYKIVVK